MSAVNLLPGVVPIADVYTVRISPATNDHVPVTGVGDVEAVPEVPETVDPFCLNSHVVVPDASAVPIL